MTTPSLDARPSVVLIANDQEWTARSLESMLGPNGYAVLRAFTGRQCIELARATQPDAIIVDLHLPDMDGLDVLRALSELPTGELIPRIAVTSDVVSRGDRLRAMEAGAWAVYTHPLDGPLLHLQLRAFVHARRRAYSLLDSSLLDADSGLYNARGLARRARELGAEAQRRREPLACVAFAPDLVDGDAAQGYAEQVEETVRRLVELMAKAGRLSDVIGRLGQTEFAVLLPATEAEGALKLIERLQGALRDDALRTGVPGEPRLRAGYAAVSDFGAASVDAVELLLRAAAAMRHTRSSGTGRSVAAFDEVRANYPH